MGMDVYGKNPTSETGGYFRRNVWGWRPLADLILGLCPEEAADCKYWHSNDGDGLDAAGSVKLADELQRLVDSGDVAAWCQFRAASLAGLPDERCDLCGGTGVRTDGVGQQMRQPERVIGPEWNHKPDHPRFGEKGWCNGCDGRGRNRPLACSYHVDPDDVAEFIAFLRDCGGFEIC